MSVRRICLLLLVLGAPAVASGDRQPNPAQDILVTLEARTAVPASGGAGPPYRKRKRYPVSLDVQMLVGELGRDYKLREIARWPIRSLSVFCIVYRAADGDDRDSLLTRLRADTRVESAQPLQQFETRSAGTRSYDDALIDMQRSLNVMEIPAAHRLTTGQGVRIAVVDSAADVDHEDLQGRVRAVHVFTDRPTTEDDEHGTAIASIIGASANNSLGIVGIAPEASIEMYVACWNEAGTLHSVCDSFTLAKALDALVPAGPDIVNLSLSGPRDPLLERLLLAVRRTGTVIFAARSGEDAGEPGFPAASENVISVASSDVLSGEEPLSPGSIDRRRDLFAPADRIVVALPRDNYDFRSGSSLAAAHATGVAALLLAVAPRLGQEALEEHLRRSQRHSADGRGSINACAALQAIGASADCR
ncbi:MAG: S8 family serine peptidase [Woeseia sp.]